MGLLGIDTYRWTTRLSALRRLYTLDQSEIDAFMDAYRLFDGDLSNRNGKREEQIIDYYNILNHLCSLGTVEKMYFPPLLDASVGVVANQVLFEQKMMRDLGLEASFRVLEIGCGRGRVAHHVASHTGAHVTALNIDPSQLQSAREFVRREGLEDRCDFRQGSLNDPLPFKDESFEAAYEIQAFSYMKDKVAVFSEIFRVLRPGARFSYLDWVLLPAFDPENPEHTDLLRRACPLLGAVDSPPLQDIVCAMEESGFEVVLNENPSLDGQQHSLISSEDDYFHRIQRLIELGVKLRLMPRYFVPLMNRLMKDADALIEMDRLGIGTTAYHIVCEKPAY